MFIARDKKGTLMKKCIAIDMDETICDTMSRHLDWYNSEFGQSLTKSDIYGVKIYNRVPQEHSQRVREYPDSPEFFKDIPPYDGALDVIRKLSEHFDIVIATAAMEHPNSFSAKYEWLRKYLPFIPPLNYIFCGKKKFISADYLIDDSSRHFDGFCGQGMLFTAPHNVLETPKIRLSSWDEVHNYFFD